MAGLGGGLGDQRGELPLMADVNVTSLVDVMLVLLIIFMLTAPIMQGGVDVELPRAEARPLSPKEGMVVTVNRDGRIFVDQTPVSYNDFRVTFRSLVATRKPTGVYLQADTRVPYGQVVRVLAIIRAAGDRMWDSWRRRKGRRDRAGRPWSASRHCGRGWWDGSGPCRRGGSALHPGASSKASPPVVCGRARRGARSDGQAETPTEATPTTSGGQAGPGEAPAAQTEQGAAGPDAQAAAAG